MIPYVKIFFLVLSSLFALVDSQGVCRATCDFSSGSEKCTFTAKIDLHAGELGYYTFEECRELGPNPTLAMKRNVSYEFIQDDISNWMHPLGFAYEADGAHVDKDELEAGVKPPGSGIACDENNACPAPRYKRNGVLMDGTIDGFTVGSEDSAGGLDFGLEAYEHMFYYPINQWAGYGLFSISLTFDSPDFGSDIFYFCHIHSGMSGRIKFVNDDNDTVQIADNLPEIPYDYDTPSLYDRECGTFGLDDYQLPNSQCLSQFVCDPPDGALGKYSKCYDAMNCAMMIGMTTNVDDEKSLFLHQMIPHHQNAVNMAKALLKTGDSFFADLTISSSEDGSAVDGVAGAESEDTQTDNSGSDPDYCFLDALLRSVVSEQNSQIQTMRGLLDAGGYKDENDCEVIVSTAELSSEQKMRNLHTVEEEKSQVRENRQLDGDGVCKATCKGDQCYFTAKINFFAGELGYYEFEECPELGTNPTLGIKKGVSYVFSQADSSNWMHPLGLAYYADGAHAEVDELEPGIPPPRSMSNCGGNNSCPAPMYSLNGEFLGDYSNDPQIFPVAGGEDFGLDTIEALYYRPIGDWVGYGEFSVSLLFDVEDFDDDIFYFCHIHSGMSGRIKFIDDYGNVLQEEDYPELPYDYDKPSKFDEECGTFGLDKYQLPNNQCPSTFVCNKPSGPLGDYANCYDAMNCAMAVGMTTKVEDTVSLFIHQMIPHHQNAVNMAKALLKSNKISCYDVTQETNDCELHKILVSIINLQNHQIQVMRSILDGKDLKEDYDCNVLASGDFSSEDEKLQGAKSEDAVTATESEDAVTGAKSEDEASINLKNNEPTSEDIEDEFESSAYQMTNSLLLLIVGCIISALLH